MAFVEWKFFLDIKDSKALDDPDDSSLQVHGVEVNESLSTVDKFLALFNSEINTKFSAFFIIIFDWLNGVAQEFWNIGFAELNCFHESVITKNWHDSRNNVLFNSSSTAVFHPLQVDLTVVEQLSDDDISTCITLLLKMLDVQVSIGLSHVHLWVSSNNNAEIVTITLSDKSNKLGSVSESIFDWSPVFDTSWRISSERQNIPDTIFFGFVQRFDDSVPG